MKEQFYLYIVSLYKDVPERVYEGLVSVFCLGAVLMLACCGFKKGLRYSSGLLFVEYVFLVFCSTVIFRTSYEGQGHNFHPFWSYVAIREGRENLLPENIMNVVAFVPIGILLGFMVKGSWSQNGSQDSQTRKSDQKSSAGLKVPGLTKRPFNLWSFARQESRAKSVWLIVLMTGLMISVSIEAMQYFFHRGFAETDDVMHNTVGCAIGFGLYKLTQLLFVYYYNITIKFQEA